MVMTVKIGDFRNRLSSYLRKIRQGAEIVIADRKTPIGRIIPFNKKVRGEELQILEPPRGFLGLRSLSFPPSSWSDRVLEELLEERRKR